MSIQVANERSVRQGATPDAHLVSTSETGQRPRIEASVSAMRQCSVFCPPAPARAADRGLEGGRGSPGSGEVWGVREDVDVSSGGGVEGLHRTQRMMGFGVVLLERPHRMHRRYMDYPAPPVGCSWSLGYHMRMLTLHLLDTWDQVGAGSQTTNNTAERMIGLLLKIRSKTMRGFVVPENILRLVHLAAYLWENRADCDLKAVC